MCKGGTISCTVETLGKDPCPGSLKLCRVIVPLVAHDCRSYNVSEMQSGSPTGTAVGCDTAPSLQTLVGAQTYGSAPSMLLSVRGSPAAIRTASAQANSTTQSVGVEVRVTQLALVNALIRTIEYSADSLPGRSEYACVASVGSGGASTVVAEWFGDRERRLLSAALGAWGGNSTSLLSTVHANVTLASQAESVDGVPLLRRGGSTELVAATLHVSNVNVTQAHSLLSAASSVKLVVAFIQMTPTATLSVTTTQTVSVMASPSPSPTLTSLGTLSTWGSAVTDSWTGSSASASHSAPVSETTTMCPPPSIYASAEEKLAVGTATTASVVMSSALSGGLELQGAVVLSTMGCFDTRGTESSARLSVVPLYDGARPWVGALANLCIAAFALVLHALIVLIVRVRGDSGLPDEWRAACCKCRFPSLFGVRVFALAYQGLCQESFRGLAMLADGEGATDTISTPACAVAATICVVTPFVVAVYCRRNCGCHSLDGRLAGACAAPNAPAAVVNSRASSACSDSVRYTSYSIALAAYPSVVRVLVLPDGFWDPHDERTRRLGALYSGCRGPQCAAVGSSLPYFVALAMGAISALPSRGMFIAVSSLCVVAALTVRPQRIGVCTVGSVLLNGATAALAVLGMAPSPPRSVMSALLGAMSVVSIFVNACRIGIALLERRWRRTEGSTAAAAAALDVPMLTNPL